MGHETLQMIHEKYYSYIKNYQRDDGSAFMEKVYRPLKGSSAHELDTTMVSENFIPNLHQTKNGELAPNAKPPDLLVKYIVKMVPKAGLEPARA